jgi:hypothetical protein
MRRCYYGPARADPRRAGTEHRAALPRCDLVTRWLPTILIAGCGAAPASEPIAATPPPVVAPTPCFPDRRAVAALDLYRETEKYAVQMGALGGQGGEVGTCRVDHQGVIWTAADVRVGQVHCGLDVLVPDIVDPSGLGVGAVGQDVLDAYGAARVAELTCMPDWTDDPAAPLTRCWLPDPDADDPSYDATGWGYVVEGEAADPCPPDHDGPCDQVVRGERARAFFAARRVVELQYRGWCH